MKEDLIIYYNPVKGITFTIYPHDLNGVEKIRKKYDDMDFLIISDDHTKEFLLKNFSSGSRGGLYNPDMPSVSQIVGALYPKTLDNEYHLIEWFFKTDQVTNKEKDNRSDRAMMKGTFVHKVLELAMIDKKNGVFIPDVDRYVKLALNDEEIIKTDWLPKYKGEFNFIGTQMLSDFIYRVEDIHPVHTEVYVCGDKVQGCIDLIAEVDRFPDRRLTLVDFKTTSKLNKYSGAPIFTSEKYLSQYKRQLCLYHSLLYECDLGLTKEQLDDMDFVIYQFHLISFVHKQFVLDRKEIQGYRQEIKSVLDWFCEKTGKG